MPDADELSALLLKLYGAPAEPALWTGVFEQITQAAGLGGMAVLFQDMVNNRYSSQLHYGRYHDEIWKLYDLYYGPLDAYRPRFEHTPESDIAWGDELCPRNEMLQTEFYNDLLRPYDVRLVCATWSLKRPKRNEVILFHQNWKSPDPSPDQMSTLNVLLPHLRLALRTRQQLARLADTESTLAGALDTCHYGILLLSRDGACLHVNRYATELLGRSDGLEFKQKQLRATRPSENTRLETLIQGACSVNQLGVGRRGGAISISRFKGSALQVLVSPFFSEQVSEAVSGGSRAAAIVLISDPDHHPLGRAQALQMLYRLTPAESRLVEQLAAGLSMAEAASANRVTQETVKSQLKSIFNKTGTRRQVDLLRVVSALPALKLR